MRAQRAASASSCVTITRVAPYSRFISNRSAMTSVPEAASRLPAGSSARRSRGFTADAPTTATLAPLVISRSMSRRMTRSESPLLTVLPMPRAARTLLSLILLLVCGCAWAAEKSILVFGDSLSAAYGIAQSRGWVALLGERLKRERPDYSVANASISGETSAGGLARIDAALARHRPAVVIVALGANDGLRGLPLGQMKANLGTIIEHARKNGARVLLVGMKLPPNYGHDYTSAFEKSFAEIGKRYNVALL